MYVIKFFLSKPQYFNVILLKAQGKMAVAAKNENYNYQLFRFFLQESQSGLSSTIRSQANPLKGRK